MTGKYVLLVVLVSISVSFTKIKNRQYHRRSYVSSTRVDCEIPPNNDYRISSNNVKCYMLNDTEGSLRRRSATILMIDIMRNTLQPVSFNNDRVQTCWRFTLMVLLTFALSMSLVVVYYSVKPSSHLCQGS